ncbi:MAG: GNAT family N-acetyltransferase [Aggregatilineales bacterium]|nr:GNAT family N-acetyltransferase [Aggregatilineales bacterium]HPV05723.1 GNAT family N-acetyltransferase [Aggregatilineales bacterium]
MTAALLKGRDTTGNSAAQTGQMVRTRLARDMSQIADLVEICFARRLDASGRAAVREMRLVGRLGPLLWLLGLLDELLGLGFGIGYVWRDQGRVVGNVSLYPGGVHPRLGRGWLIANVAVHPDYRRRGIARMLMEASLGLVRRKGGRWAALQVEADNDGAIHLYETLGFERFGTLEHWETSHIETPLPAGKMPGWVIRLRRPGETAAEAAFIFDRARPGAMAWTRVIERRDMNGLQVFGGLLNTSSIEHWVMTPSYAPRQLAGVLWVQYAALDRPRLTLFLDPDIEDWAARQALLRHALNLPDLRGRLVRVETLAGDPAVEDLLTQSGFHRVRSLVQMRKMLD